MNYIYNNLKGVIKLLCSCALILSVASCAQGTDEDLVTPEIDSLSMGIQPTGYEFFVSGGDDIDNRPLYVLVIEDRVINSWRGACILCYDSVGLSNYRGRALAFDSESCSTSDDAASYLRWTKNSDDYLNNSANAGKYLSFTAGKYNFLAMTYDPEHYDYTEVINYIKNTKGDSTLSDLSIYYRSPKYQENTNLVESPKRIISALSNRNLTYLDGAGLQTVADTTDGSSYTYGTESYLQMYPNYLTQRYKWKFVINKTDDIARIEGVTAYIDGLPYAINLKTGVADASKLMQIKSFCTLSHKDGFESGRDTVSLAVDATAILKPQHSGKINATSGNTEIGYIYLYITLYNESEGKTKTHIVRHKMTELNDFEDYSLKSDARHLTVNGGSVWSVPVDQLDAILINKDTINARSNSHWTVIKNAK